MNIHLYRIGTATLIICERVCIEISVHQPDLICLFKLNKLLKFNQNFKLMNLKLYKRVQLPLMISRRRKKYKKYI